METCQRWDIPEVNNTCYYFDVFDQKMAFLDVNSTIKNVPKTKNYCNQNLIFDLGYFNELSIGEKNMRAACFGQFDEVASPANIPLDLFKKPMLIFEEQELNIRWNKTINTDMNKKSFKLQMDEYSDDGSHEGFNTYAFFKAK